jgi:deoxyribodipyrimidine photo-lyase
MGAQSASQKLIIYILRRDLRLSDNPVFHELSRIHNSPDATFTHILPLYVFPAHQVEISGFIPEAADPAATAKSPYPEARSQVGGFWRCGPHRVKFLAESVWDLKQSLEGTQNGLIIRAGMVEDVVSSAIDRLEAKSGNEGADGNDVQVLGVWMTADEGVEEKQEQEKVRRVVEERGKEFRIFQDEKFYIDE